MSESRRRTHHTEQRTLRPPRVDRRHFFGLVLAGGAGVVLSRVLHPVEAARFRAATPGRWSDPRTWGGKVPGAHDAVVVSSDVVLDTDARVARLVVERGARLSFLGGRSITLESTGNVVVQGRLSMRPETRSQAHRLVFMHVDESRFAGGGMEVVESDVGLWVMDHGVLDTHGSQKLAWTRAVSGIPRGATTIKLREDPVGWRAGDRIVLTPTASPGEPGFHAAYDDAEITGIRGRNVTLSRPAQFDHPVVELKPGTRTAPEVLNLSRNVSIEGTQRGRSHALIHSHGRQRVENTLFAHMGPRRQYQGHSVGIGGRYPLHFHQCGQTSRGSVVRGAVVTGSGNHAFVPHVSDGITFVDCISHDAMEDPYWWDPPGDHGAMTHSSNGISWDRCVASLVRTDPHEKALRMSGFTLGTGDKNVIRNCVAVGVAGGEQSSGFFWRAPGEPHGPWVFDRNLAHNNESNGAFNWQNDRDVGTARRFVAYHNGAAGVLQGAYRNPYRFENAILYGNALAAIKLHAVSRHVPLRFSDSLFDGAGLSDNLVVTDDHKIAADVPTEFTRCTFRGYRHSAVWIAADRDGKGIPNWIDLVDCTYEGNELFLHPAAAAATRLRVKDRAHGDIVVRRWDQPGVPKREWNASFTPASRT